MKSKQGGKRPGAGRPPMDPLQKKTPRSLKLPEWLWRAVDEQTENRAIVIERALRDHLGL